MDTAQATARAKKAQKQAEQLFEVWKKSQQNGIRQFSNTPAADRKAILEAAQKSVANKFWKFEKREILKKMLFLYQANLALQPIPRPAVSDTIVRLKQKQCAQQFLKLLVIFFVVLSAFFLLPSQIKDTSAQISFYPANVSQNITMVSYKIPANTSLYMITLQEMQIVNGSQPDQAIFTINIAKNQQKEDITEKAKYYGNLVANLLMLCLHIYFFVMTVKSLYPRQEAENNPQEMVEPPEQGSHTAPAGSPDLFDNE